MRKPLERLLRPLVRLLIRCGITFPVAADLLRTIYVEVAVRDLPAAERTDSRVSLLTGVHRKEIRRLRTLPQDEAEPPMVTRNSRLIGTWLGAAAYTDAAGAPRPLPRTGPAPSFERLVESVTRDVRARAVLDDWLAQGVATIDEAGLVRLQVAALVPAPGQEEQLYYLGRNLHDHIAAAAANVLAEGQAPFLDRTVHYDRLSEAAAAELERRAREAAMAALLEVNRQALALSETDPPASAPTRRVNFGIYLFSADEPAE
jgi:hypothetical protein